MVSLMRQCRGLTAETSAIWRSPTTGWKHVSSERERSSQPCFPPADAPGARRFRLTFLLRWWDGAFHPTMREEIWRGLRSRSAGRWTGPLKRTLAFGAMTHSSGPRSSFDDRDLTGAEFWLGAFYASIKSAIICVICSFLRWVGGEAVTPSSALSLPAPTPMPSLPGCSHSPTPH